LTALSDKLVLKEISKSFGGMTVLDRVSLTVRSGEFVSIIGPSGSGKSTLLDIIAGLTGPDHGQVWIDGKETTSRRGHAAYMPQKDVLLPWRTIVDNVAIPLELNGMSKKEARQEAERWLPQFGLGGFAKHYPHQLSGGMRQRAAFLRTCLCKKELMLLDEPFGSLDALTRLDMQRWLMEVWQAFHTSVLLITHDIEEAIFLSDRIYVFSPRPGKVAGEVSVELERPRRVEMTASEVFVRTKAKLMHILQTSYPMVSTHAQKQEWRG
jgi:ABC-type nitrate/sulfonate/bicarbonate transport system ATPase subunit